MQHNKIIEVFHNMKLESIVSKQELVTLKATNTIEDVVKILAKNKVTSAPVMDGNTCLGLVDMLDIVNFVIKVSPNPDQIQEAELAELKMAGRAMALEEVKYVIGASGNDPYVPLQANDPVSRAVQLFAGGVHRVVIADHTGVPKHTVSQSDIVKILVQHMLDGHLKRMGYLNKTVSEIGFGSVQPHAVSKSTTVIGVLSTINNKGTTAVAVVDESGKLIGNFSATDLVGLYTEKWPHFKHSVHDYLTAHSPNSLKNVVSVTPSTTFEEVLHKFKDNKIHRLWITDKDGKPTGVLSMTDIMKYIRDSN
eukprot:TRINITY_DN1809_c0_g1_i11.p3 TRINITY_DN1809_c0_g1~~TRINITY_DN1809_c0_g1_i11.p3  ORF type:complete len:308 (+),score=81.93 TRINITY_DN1809_c0_g1_i11:4439-5362(+)